MKRAFHLSCFLLALLFLTSSAEMVEVMRDNNGRCAAVMDPKGCVLSSCKQRCLQQKNGNGVCLANLKEGSYQCVCYVNC